MQLMMSIVFRDIRDAPESGLASSPENATKAEDTPPSVTAMPIHERNVRSLAACKARGKREVSRGLMI